MRRRKNIIISAITCMFSICLMMFGVYAASNPNVSINGQVSYTARDASVLVQGKMYGADGYESVDYKTVTDPTSPTTDDVLTNSVSQYVDYTSADQNKTTLATWNLGDQLKFYEDENGIRKVNVCLKFTNLSNYPVMATAVFENKTATNVKTTQSPTDGKMAMTTIGSVGSDCEMSFVFEVEDDSKNANIDFKLVVTIEKTVLQNYTATFSSGTKQFSNQSNATTYDVSETTVLEEAPELYFVENEGNRRVALWYDNQECQGEPIKFPYVLCGNKTFYAVWEVNRRVFNFYDYGNDIQVMFDGYKAFRTQSLRAASTPIFGWLDLTEEDLKNDSVLEQIKPYADIVKVGGNTYFVFKQKNIFGFQVYNNLICDFSDKALYIIPGYTYEELIAKVAKGQYEEIFKKMVGGYSIVVGGDAVLELYFVTTKSKSEINVQVINGGKEVASQVGYNITSQVNNLQKYNVTLHSGSEHQFITGVEDVTDGDTAATKKYVNTDTLTVQMSILTKIASTSAYSSVGEYTTGNGDKIYVEGWYENADLSGEPISLPYTLTKDTNLYAKWEYNSKRYTLDENAKNIEIWVKDKKVLVAKDTSFVQNNDCFNVIADTVVEFKQTDIIEYVDTNFKLLPGGFLSYDFYMNDWNIGEFSDAASFTNLPYCLGTIFNIRKNNGKIEIYNGRAEDLSLDSLKEDDLKVYVDGVEADFTWARVVWD